VFCALNLRTDLVKEFTYSSLCLLLCVTDAHIEVSIFRVWLQNFRKFCFEKNRDTSTTRHSVAPNELEKLKFVQVSFLTLVVM